MLQQCPSMAEHVLRHDDGVQICRAESELGWTVSTWHDPPFPFVHPLTDACAATIWCGGPDSPGVIWGNRSASSPVQS